MNCCFDCTAHAQILCRQKHCSIIPLPIKHCSSMDVIEMEFSDSSEQLDKDDKIKYKSKLLIDIFLADIYHYLKTTRREIPTKTPLEAFNFFVCNHVQDVYFNEISLYSEFCCILLLSQI